MNKAQAEVFRYISRQNGTSATFLSAIWLILMLPVLVEDPHSRFVWINAFVLALFDVNLMFHRRQRREINEDNAENTQRTYILANYFNAIYWGSLIAYILHEPSYIDVRFSAALMLAFSTISGFYVWLLSRFAGRVFMVMLFTPSIAVLMFSGEVSSFFSAAFILFSLVIIVQQGDTRAKLFIASAQQQVSLAEQADRYKKISNLDALTKTNNRRYFDQVLATELERTFDQGNPLSLLVIDIDHFKQVNDTHGHAAGDVCLQHCADLIRHEIRSNDILCRYGGEEFSLILPDCNRETAEMVSRRICQAFRDRPVSYQGLSIEITVSIGSATVQDKACSDKALFELADKALYEAKESGRDRYITYSIDEMFSKV